MAITEVEDLEGIPNLKTVCFQDFVISNFGYEIGGDPGFKRRKHTSIVSFGNSQRVHQIPLISMEDDFESWQEFEEYTRDILENFRFEVEFRKVFSDSERKYEIDVVGRRSEFVICIDCKLYKNKDRVSSLKQEAKKHLEKVERLSELESGGKDYIPLIITSLDDSLLIENRCLFIPHFKLNDFLNNIHIYLDELNYSGSDDEFQRAN